MLSAPGNPYLNRVSRIPLQPGTRAIALNGVHGRPLKVKAASSRCASAATTGALTLTINLPAPARRVYEIVSDPAALPRWAHPVKAVRTQDGFPVADYQLPERVVTCRYETRADPRRLRADWTLRLPEGPEVRVRSRVRAVGARGSRYEFTLEVPRGPRASLDALRRNIERDLRRLRALVLAGSRADSARARRPRP